jgi:hypothetical protein
LKDEAAQKLFDFLFISSWQLKNYGGRSYLGFPKKGIYVSNICSLHAVRSRHHFSVDLSEQNGEQ